VNNCHISLRNGDVPATGRLDCDLTRRKYRILEFSSCPIHTDLSAGHTSLPVVTLEDTSSSFQETKKSLRVSFSSGSASLPSPLPPPSPPPPLPCPPYCTTLLFILPFLPFPPPSPSTSPLSSVFIFIFLHYSLSSSFLPHVTHTHIFLFPLQYYPCFSPSPIPCRPLSSS
jgi:hypothetical protein